MLHKLRLRFIKITGLSVLAVILLIMIAINGVNIVQNLRSIDGITQQLVENGGVFKKPGRNDFPRNDSQPPQPYTDFHNKDELPFSARYVVVYLDNDNTQQIIRYDMDHIASISAEEIESMTASILSTEKETGWLGNYRFRLGEFNNSPILVIAEATFTKAAIFNVLWISAIVGLISFAIVLLLVTCFSKKAIAPIAESYEKQKEFITNAGHELKTPLTVISANTEILSMTYGKNEWCDGIMRQSASMKSLIGQMIQMAKLDEDTPSLVYENFSVSDALFDTAMSFSPLAGKKQIHFTVEPLPEYTLKGDEGAIRQVFSILTDNAVKYCDANGSISVKASLQKSRYLITFENTCLNVSDIDTKKIFERFHREDAARSENGGYGLGLAIAKSIIAKHKGTLTALKGDGTLIFKVLL